jgi:hypothetical protein
MEGSLSSFIREYKIYYTSSGIILCLKAGRIELGNNQKVLEAYNGN